MRRHNAFPLLNITGNISLIPDNRSRRPRYCQAWRCRHAAAKRSTPRGVSRVLTFPVSVPFGPGVSHTSEYPVRSRPCFTVVIFSVEGAAIPGRRSS